MSYQTNRPKAIDLFAGAGGLGEGLTRSGIDVVAAIEEHPQPAWTYAFNHPQTTVFAGDIREGDFDRVSRVIGEKPKDIDIVVGGPPCQGFSSAGKEKRDDPRNTLFEEFSRAVGYFEPSVFLFENVPGFKNKYDGEAYERAKELLRPRGYKMKDVELNAIWYGVPQRRKRFIMVGWNPSDVEDIKWPTKKNVRKGNKNLFDKNSNVESPVTTYEALEDISFLESSYEAHRQKREPVSEFQKRRRKNTDNLFNHLATDHRSSTKKMFSYIPEGGTISDVPEEHRSSKRTMARMDRSDVSNAVLAMPDDLLHYAHHRIPTVREMARLQSFDDDYVFFGKRTSGYKERRVDVPQYTQVGNAVPPLMAESLGKSISKAFGIEPKDMRKLEKRNERLEHVYGSSGYAGYVISEELSEKINLKTIYGSDLNPPTNEEEERVVEREGIENWKKGGNPRKGQWAPGIKSRDVPAHVRNKS
ncbi:DNA (cytosine-5)-methyltransferase 1 [Salinibacter ruber]|uniref:DNA cytosine methyltransferase n=1 Tax=Salinibacter ruber TaxID=146919 RepID=UPI00216937BC|nr:DNA cytosine methyltransferase [Salinibacter ruber]MCS3863315.1 DNA (cytosine-5)-methyltransferase 1 [Salinibacter ruber]